MFEQLIEILVVVLGQHMTVSRTVYIGLAINVLTWCIPVLQDSRSLYTMLVILFLGGKVEHIQDLLTDGSSRQLKRLSMTTTKGKLSSYYQASAINEAIVSIIAFTTVVVLAKLLNATHSNIKNFLETINEEIADSTGRSNATLTRRLYASVVRNLNRGRPLNGMDQHGHLVIEPPTAQSVVASRPRSGDVEVTSRRTR